MINPSSISTLILLSPEDNCLVACSNLAAGTPVQLDGTTVALPQTVPLGYKVARQNLAAGQAVVRYGAPIGSTTHSVAAGELLHTHNLQSDYLPTYTLADGKRFGDEQLN
jgi:hypothetical protein